MENLEVKTSTTYCPQVTLRLTLATARFILIFAELHLRSKHEYL
jgi:hypothetical protein